MVEATMKLQKHFWIFFVNNLDNRYRKKNFIRPVWVWFDRFDYQTMECHQELIQMVLRIMLHHLFQKNNNTKSE